MRPVRLSVMLLALSLWACSNASLTAETAPAKLAIVDVSTREPVRPGFVELVMAAVSSDPGVALLEREEINRLLHEQTLTLGIRGTVESQAAVKAGRVWGADSFLMLEAESNSAVRVRLVDTRYGVVLWDSALVLGATAQELTQQAEAIATRTQRKLPLLQRDLASVFAVSVAAIRCEEISRKYDWMAERLATGLEQQLDCLPGMLVLGRRSTRSLMEERTLVTGLPESLRAAVLLVEGDFKIEHGKELDTVSLTIRGRRGAAVKFEERVNGAAKDLDLLCREAARVITAKSGLAEVSHAMDPTREAQLLVAEAQGCERVGEPLRAEALAEAAYALQPQNRTNAYLVLHLLTQASVLVQSNALAERSAGEYGLAVAERVMRDPTYLQPKSPGELSNLDHEINSALYRYVFSCLKHGAVVDFDPGFADVFRRAGENERQHRTPAYNSYLEMKRRMAVFQRTPADALQLMEAGWRDGVSYFEANADGFWGCWTLLLPTSPFDSEPVNCHSMLSGSYSVEHWRSVAGVEDAYVTLLLRCRRDPDPLVRVGVESALLELYAGRTGYQPTPIGNPTKARESLERMVAGLETDLIPLYGGSRSSRKILAQIAYRPMEMRFADNQSEDSAIHLQYGCRIVEAALKTGRSLAAYGFLKLLSEIVPQLEEAGQTDKAVDFLARALALCGDMPDTDVVNTKKLLERLQPGHPLAAGAQLEVLQPPARLRLGFSAGSDWPAKQHMDRIFQTETGWAIYYSAGKQIGLMELTPQFKVTRERQITYTPPPPINSFYRRPAMTADGHDVFVGFANGAIIWFGAEMQPVQLPESGELSSLAVEQLAVLNHRLYAIVDTGGRDENALTEIDLVTGARTVLLSSRTKEPKNELDGRPLFGLLADPTNQCLWVFGDCGRDQDGVCIRELILAQYNPRTGSVQSKVTPHLADCFWGGVRDTYLARSGGVTLMVGSSVCKRLGNEAHVLSTTVAEGQDFSRRSPPISVGNDLVAVHKNQLIYYKADVCEPFYALDSPRIGAGTNMRRPRLVLDVKSLSEATHGATIRDLFSLGKDFLVLTDDAIWLVEMPTAIDSRPLESAAKSP